MSLGRQQERPTRRERQWTRTRQVELAYVVVFSAVFIYGMQFRPSGVVFWLFGAVLWLSGLGIWGWQYRALDELGRARFALSWMVGGMVLSSGVSLLLLWVIYETVSRGETFKTPPAIPFWPLAIVLYASMLILWLTNLYLRRREDG